MTEPKPPEGTPDWYPDPLRSDRHRWFDGMGWTNAVLEGPPRAPVSDVSRVAGIYPTQASATRHSPVSPGRSETATRLAPEEQPSRVAPEKQPFGISADLLAPAQSSSEGLAEPSAPVEANEVPLAPETTPTPLAAWTQGSDMDGTTSPSADNQAARSISGRPGLVPTPLKDAYSIQEPTKGFIVSRWWAARTSGQRLAGGIATIVTAGLVTAAIAGGTSRTPNQNGGYDTGPAGNGGSSVNTAVRSAACADVSRLQANLAANQQQIGAMQGGSATGGSEVQDMNNAPIIVNLMQQDTLITEEITAQNSVCNAP